MKVNKTPQNDLESKRIVFFLLGIAISLSAIYTAFQWKSYQESLKNFGIVRLNIPEEQPIIRTYANQPKVQKIKISEKVAIDPFDITFPDIPEFTDTTGIENLDTLFTIDTTPEIIETFLITGVQRKPVFQGCEEFLSEEERFECFNQKMIAYISKNYKYPKGIQGLGVSGRIFVNFTINEKGYIVNPEIVRSVHPELDKEALRVLKSVPVMEPAKQNGKAVRVQYTVPIKVSG